MRKYLHFLCVFSLLMWVPTAMAQEGETWFSVDNISYQETEDGFIETSSMQLYAILNDEEVALESMFEMSTRIYLDENGDYVDSERLYEGLFGTVIVPETATYTYYDEDYNECYRNYTVTAIGFQAFAGFSTIDTVVLPNTITLIDQEAFYGCTADVELPNSLITIGAEAFYGNQCSSFYIPASVESIGDCAFASQFLQKFTVSEDNQYYCSIEDMLYSKDGETIIAYPSGKEIIDLTLPEGTKEIGFEAFIYAQSIYSLNIPEGVERIGRFAFDMANISYFNIPSSVTEIAEPAFYYTRDTNIEVNEDNEYYCDVDGILFDKEMTKLIRYPYHHDLGENPNRIYKVPSSVKTIGEYAFQYASFIDKLYIPEGVEVIDDSAFDASGNYELYLPSTLRKLGGFVFSSSWISDIYLSCPDPSQIEIDNYYTFLFFNSISKCTLWVPIGSKELYEQAEGWSSFGEIKEFDPAGIADAKYEASCLKYHSGMISNPDRNYVTISNLSGQIVYSGNDDLIALPGNGLFIVRTSNTLLKVFN